MSQRHVAIVFMLIVPVCNAWSQEERYDQVLQQYQQTAGVYASLYRGKVFTEYPSKISGSAFFGEDWAEGSLLCDGIEYRRVQMRYDVVGNVVIVDHKNLGSPIQIDPTRVEWFSIFGHRFAKMYNNNVADFYDVLLDEKIKVLVKRKKVAREKIDEQDRSVRNWFEDQNEYYVVRDNIFYRIRSKKSLLDVLADKKKPLKKFIGQSSLSISREPENTLVKAVQFYNQQQ